HGVGVGLYAGGTVTNAGTITGSGGIAVNFAGTDSNRLVVDPGAVFNGAVSANMYASNTLELASGGTGTLSGLGTKFTNFETVTVDNGASWKLSGSNALSAGQTLVDAGTLSGKLAVSDGGILEVTGGGTAIGATVSSGGTLELFGGAITSAVTINVGGTLEIASGYSVSNYVVSSGFTLEVGPGGTASGVTVSNGGT